MFLVLIVTLNECKKLGLIALFLSNILKWKYYTAILMVVFNSVNKFCCFFTFKVSSTCCYSFSEWVLFTAFSIFRIYTNDGGGGDNLMWCDVMWSVWVEERPMGGPYFFPHFVNKWKNIVWFGQFLLKSCSLFWLWSDFWAFYSEKSPFLIILFEAGKPAHVSYGAASGSLSKGLCSIFHLVLGYLFTSYAQYFKIHSMLKLSVKNNEVVPFYVWNIRIEDHINYFEVYLP